jgi:hypothetical protein
VTPNVSAARIFEPKPVDPRLRNLDARAGLLFILFAVDVFWLLLLLLLVLLLLRLLLFIKPVLPNVFLDRDDSVLGLLLLLLFIFMFMLPICDRICDPNPLRMPELLLFDRIFVLFVLIASLGLSTTLRLLLLKPDD